MSILYYSSCHGYLKEGLAIYAQYGACYLVLLRSQLSTP